ncbi:hypothetical protein [Chryseobacterium carnipullorum]|uniref:hypothetical protein n=1 Tax=Chryseobacterium carnipullorum TaxID=1124835 RepID=UPI001E4794BF|nr:hypothetical protein [Chryseobacterium carnipullorum]
MEEHLETQYVKRTQRDYNLSLKLQIVREIEAGKSGITDCRKNTVYKHALRLLVGLENMVTLIGKIKIHLP